MVHV
jgi:hypothetical protein